MSKHAAHRKHIKENRGGRDDRPAGTPGATPLVRLMQSHSPAALAGITSHNSMTRPGFIQGALMGPDEYASDITRPWQYTLADYDVRATAKGWGIYTRKFNVCLAHFAPNTAALRNALAQVFNELNEIKCDNIEAFKRSKLPVDQQIKLRQADERKINKGWYTCQCGQWVNDKTCPCSMCRCTWGVADARVKLPKGHRFSVCPKCKVEREVDRKGQSVHCQAIKCKLGNAPAKAKWKRKSKLDDARTKLPKRHAFRHMRDSND